MIAHATQWGGLTKGALWKETFKEKQKKKEVVAEGQFNFHHNCKDARPTCADHLLFLFFLSFVLENRSWHWQEHVGGEVEE